MAKINLKSGIVLCLFFVIVVAIVVYFNYKEMTNVDSNEYGNIVMLDDIGLFFSVNKNINKFITYVNDKNKDAISSITSSFDYNLYNKFDSVVFSAYEIYVVSKDNHYKFFVDGYLKRDEYNSSSVINEKIYFVLDLDIINSVYLLNIIDEKSYKSFIKNNNFEYNEISINEFNSFEYDNIDEKNLPIIYFNDFYNNVFSNSKYAYDSILYDTKKEYFSSYDEFLNKIKEGYFDNISFDGYVIEDSVYKCRDNKGNVYSFIANGVMNYTVRIEFAN